MADPQIFIPGYVMVDNESSELTKLYKLKKIESEHLELALEEKKEECNKLDAEIQEKKRNLDEDELKNAQTVNQNLREKIEDLLKRNEEMKKENDELKYKQKEGILPVGDNMDLDNKGEDETKQQQLVTKIQEMSVENQNLQKKLQEYESSLKTCTQRLEEQVNGIGHANEAEDIVKKAKNEAEDIVKKANHKAQQIVDEALKTKYANSQFYYQKSFHETLQGFQKAWEEMKKFVHNVEAYKLQNFEELASKLPKFLKEMSGLLDDVLSQTRKKKKNDDETIDLKVELEQYSKEWKGETKNAGTIRDGIQKLQENKFSSLFVIKGDNYCGLRATLFSMLVRIENPPKIDSIDFVTLKNSHPWTELRDGSEECLKLLLDVFQKFTEMKDGEERVEQVRDFFTRENDLKLMEALKILMIVHSIKLYDSFISEQDAREFVMILFCRENMENPEKLMKNSICYIGKNLGIEQIELFLLADALSINIDIYRLVKSGDSEFCSKIQTKDTPELNATIPIVTVDDRHYNVPF